MTREALAKARRYTDQITFEGFDPDADARRGSRLPSIDTVASGLRNGCGSLSVSRLGLRSRAPRMTSAVTHCPQTSCTIFCA